MSRALANDIDYLIEKKENYVEKLKEEGKSTESIEIEMEILQKARDLILDGIIIQNEQSKKNAEVEAKERINNIQILRGKAVESALILACLYQKEYSELLAEIVYYPERIITKLKEQEYCIEQTEKQIEFIENNYNYTNEYARKAYKDLCNFAGIDFNKKATAWKNKTKVREEIDKGDTRNPEQLNLFVLQNNITQYITTLKTQHP